MADSIKIIVSGMEQDTEGRSNGFLAKTLIYIASVVIRPAEKMMVLHSLRAAGEE
jgi:hypothetical protein